MGVSSNFLRGAVLVGAGMIACAAIASLSAGSSGPATLRANAVIQQNQSSGDDLWSQGDQSQRSNKQAIDRSGAKRLGKASFYANFFAGRKMADGRIMNPEANNAASRTLPLGTTAKVTNLETGKSAVVIIQDRGPYVGGRIVDLSPATARKIGISRREGIAKVAVTPIAVPMPDGRVKLGAAAHDPEVAVNFPRYDRGTSGAGW